MSKPRVVVCAAVLIHLNRKGFVTLIGPRHWDSSMSQAKNMMEGHTDGREVQGFIDQYGVFMDREEAWKVAEAAGQIKYPEGTNKQGVLYSENLY